MSLFASLLLVAMVHAASEEDPYIWLEDVTGERSMQWVAERDAQTEKALEGRDYAALQQRILSIMDSNDKIPYVTKIGDSYYNLWQDAAHVRGLWRRASLEEYRKAQPAWEPVLDLDALDAAEGTPWVWHGATCLPPAWRRCMISLSPGGSDADEVREFDLRSKDWVKDGFRIPAAKGDVTWADDNGLYVMTDMGPGTTTTAGYPRQVRLWRRGTPLDQAPIVFEGQSADVSVWASHDFTPGFERVVFGRDSSFFAGQSFLETAEGQVHIEVPDDASAWTWREWLLVELRSDWTTGGQTWPKGSLLATKLDDFMAGGRSFQALFTPTATAALSGSTATKSAVVLEVLDNVRSRVLVARPGEGTWSITPLQGIPDIGTVSAWAVDPLQSDDLWVDSTDFLQPTTLSLASTAPDAGPPTALKALPALFDTSGLVVTQHFATSKDGTKIPYFEVARQGMKLKGKNPTLLYGYGGFEVSMTPSYSGGTGAAWLERGGVYVLANIRGGGEYGPAWHEAALREKRPRAYEDFAAVAEDLFARKVTSPAHLGIMGGSNGGLLMGNMLVSYPQLFGAVVCQVPLLDMKRYSHLLAGASWMEEYGDPDDPAQWSYLQTFSPYQLVRPGVKYPPVLFMTSTRDDRVHPGHARKMAAKMLDYGDPVLYWENTEGGHGAAATNAERATMWALAWTFLWDELR